MADIREYPNFGELEGWALNVWNEAEALVAEEEDIPDIYPQAVGVEEIVVYGEYGRVTGRSGDYPLKILYIVDVNFDILGEEEKPIIRTDIFDNYIREISDFLSFAGQEAFTGLMDNFFTGFEARAGVTDAFQEAINLAVIEREGEPDRAYSLTNDEFIIKTESGQIVRRGDEGEGEPDEDTEGKPSSIIQYPEKDEFVTSILDLFIDARDDVAEGTRSIESVSDFQIEEMVITGSWAYGNASYGDENLQLTAVVTSDGRSIADVPRGRNNLEEVEAILNEEFEPPELIQEWTGYNDFYIDLTTPRSGNDVEDAIESITIDSIPDGKEEELNTYGLITNEIYELEPKEPFGFRVVVQAVDEDEEVVTQEDLEEDEKEEPEEVSELPEGEEEDAEEEEETLSPREKVLEMFKEDYPDLPVDFADYFDRDEEKLEIPSGVKQTRTVEPRPLYDFELEMSEKVTMGAVPEEGFEPYTNLETFEKTMPSIGRAMKLPDGSEGNLSSAPVGSFPRPGIYVRNRLLNEGPEYVLQLYRDLLIYTAHIRERWNIDVRPGEYSTFREYMHRLYIMPDKGGPELVERLSQQQASSMGFSTVPELPDGTEAPWLERRSYYKIIEENADHPAWRDPTGYIYDVLEG